LRSVQRSPENREPNPKFDLGDLTSACVALVMSVPNASARILATARVNVLQRSSE
jgi:hypothetical protein